MTVSLLGCGGDATSPPAAADTFWRLRFNQHAVQLALTAPQNTIQLAATPLTVGGQTPAGLGPVQYVAKDSAVIVNAAGLVTAHSVTFQTALVVATVTDTVHHVTHQDTCYFQVTATAPSAPLSGFMLQSESGDTVALGQGGGSSLSVVATGGDGNAVTPFVYFSSADPSIAAFAGSLKGSLDGYSLGGKRTGQVMLYAETWAYGVAKRDSLLLTVGIPKVATVNVVPVTPTGSTHPVLTFWPQIIKVTTGAKIIWINPSFTDSIDVVFDDPTHVDSVQFGLNIIQRFASGRGNITPWVWDTTGTAADSVSARFCRNYQVYLGVEGTCPEILVQVSVVSHRLRSFPIAGTYHYHSVKWGTSGTIIVQ